jgi:hypothetical protein
MGKQIRKPYVIWLMLAIGAVFFSIVLFRAIYVPITHDEAYTYLHYVRQNWLGIILYKPPHIPNNHILNTLLAKLSVGLFGLSDFNLRLPNVLASLIYFRYAAAIARKFRFPGIQIAAFLVLCLQLYFIDFFAMARGYGMGLALSLASIFHLYSYRELNNGHHIWRTLLFAAFAVYANFTFLYSYVALVALILILYVAEGENQTKSLGTLWRPVGIVTGVLGLLIFLPLKNISGDLFGSDANFWESSVHSLTWILTYKQHFDIGVGFSYLIGLALIIGAVYFILDHLRASSSIGWYYYGELFLWLIMTAGAQIAQHWILGTEYLIGRTTLVYAPLLLVYLLFLFQRFNRYPKGENVQLVLSVFLVLCFALSFKDLNFKSTAEWPYDAAHKSFIQDLESNRPQELETLQIGVNWLFEPALNFYRLSEDLNYLQEFSREGYRDKAYDGYYLWPEKDQEMISELQAPQSGYHLLKSYSNGAVFFLREDYL